MACIYRLGLVLRNSVVTTGPRLCSAAANAFGMYRGHWKSGGQANEVPSLCWELVFTGIACKGYCSSNWASEVLKMVCHALLERIGMVGSKSG